MDHVIVWLDKYVAKPNCCETLKTAFSTTIDPENVSSTTINATDISNLIAEPMDTQSGFHSIPSILRLFDDMEKCYNYLLSIAGKKRIFFITSGSSGQYILPKLLTRDPHIFQDSDGKFYEDSIYIFCADIAQHAQWADDFLELGCIKMGADENMVLCWLTKDIANYFATKGEQELSSDDIEMVKNALQHFTWARALYVKANGIWRGFNITVPLKKLDALITQAEHKIAKSED